MLTKEIQQEIEKSSSNCDNCQSNFACSRLFMSLKIAESECRRMEKSHTSYNRVAESIASIKHRLTKGGWTYPHSSDMCSYAVNIKDTWRELDAVINSIRSTKRKTQEK